MEPRYVMFRTRAGCILGLVAVMVAFVIAAFAFAFDLPKWAWIAIIAPPVGILLAIGLILDRRRVERERPAATEGVFGCTWFAIFLFVSIAAALGTLVTGLLMATGVAVPPGSSGLGLVVIGALVWASALVLSIAVARFIQHGRGE